jgi:hypothetical protein
MKDERAMIVVRYAQVVDKGSPAEEEHHAGDEAATLEHGTGEDHGGGSDKGSAECGV